MTADSNYLALQGGTITRKYAITESAGVANAGDLVALGADGLLDPSISPALQQLMFLQSIASDTWVIDHNLGRFPPIEVLDSTNRLVEGDVEYVNSNRVIIHFAAAFAGTAYVN